MDAHTTTPSMVATPNICLTVEEAARHLGIGRTFVYALIKAGDLGSAKLGRRRVIPVEAIHEMLRRKQDLKASA